MKKIVALVAALAVAGSLFADAKKVVLTNTVNGESSFGFSQDSDLATYLDDNKEVGYDLSATALYAGYKTNATEDVSLSLEAGNFVNTTKAGEEVSFTLLSSANSKTVESGKGAVVIVADDTTEVKKQRTGKTQLTYSAAPDFTGHAAGDYKATLTLTYSAK